MKIVILAGGSGTRLWPLSRKARPKQLLPLGDRESLLQKTVYRFYREWPVADIFIVTNREVLPLVQDQLAEIDSGFADQIIVEPERKNTAPAIALAMRYLQQQRGVKGEDTVFTCPADHWIEPKERLIQAMQLGEKLAQERRIAIFGIRPHKPETGYGYIEVKMGASEILPVLSFTEKPSLTLAEQYLASGNYLWNGGMFAFSLQTFWEEVASHYPLLEQPFEMMPSISIDYAIMEKSKRLDAVLLDASWSDVGSWDALYDIMPKDEYHNVQWGNVVTLDSRNSFIVGDKRLIVAVGLEDAFVVDTEDVLYLGKRQEAERILEALKNQTMEMKS